MAFARMSGCGPAPRERLVSLLEILRTHAEAFVQIVFHLGTSISNLNERDIWQDDEHRVFLAGELERLRDVCQRSELPVTLTLVERMLKTFERADHEDPFVSGMMKRTCSSELIKHDLFAMRERFMDELSTKLFLQVPHSRMAYFDSPFLGWEKIVSAFPESSRDVEEMNKCFGLSRYPAAMFHALHVAEWGAISLGEKIGVTDPKRGWGPTERRLRELVSLGHGKLPTLGVSFEFIEQMHQEVRNIALAWRHKVDHADNYLKLVPNAEFTPDIAEHIIDSVKMFMRRLMETYGEQGIR